MGSVRAAAGRGDVPAGSHAPGAPALAAAHWHSRQGLRRAAASFAGEKKKKKRNKDSFLEAGTCCELRLGSAPGFGSRRAGKAAAFRSDIFQMRRFDFDLI